MEQSNQIQINTNALVQARMGSRRFPGKMLAKLGDYPILEWVLKRVKKSKFIDNIILATSNNKIDDPLVSIGQKLNINIFRGSENDVLGRFANASKLYNSSWIIRICGDNPFIDPKELDRLIEFFKENKCDYACNHQNQLNSGYADGFGAEILSSKLLHQQEIIAKNLESREHVTQNIWDNSYDYKIKAVPAPTQLKFPELRFDVDTKEDLEYLKTLLNAGVNINTSAQNIVQIALQLNKNRFENC